MQKALELAASRLNVSVSDLIIDAETKSAQAQRKEKSTQSSESFPAVVLYNYKAQQDFEMSIAHNEIITVLSKHPNGWWLGYKDDGQRGYFPSSYVSSNFPAQ